MSPHSLELPIGDSSFRNLRTSDCYYVDKTSHLQKLTRSGRYWFLSRPRRFGKTLLVDTLHELFAGSEDLFRGLDIHPRWDWKTTHPVVRLSFDAEYHHPDTLHSSIRTQLAAHEEAADLPPRRGIRPPRTDCRP